MFQAGHGQRTSSPRSPSLLPFLTHISASQILFLIGLTLIIGTQKTLAFFARRQKWKGTAAFAVGITLILMRWAFFGFLIELYGILVLFGDFFATIAGFAGGIPVVGPYIARALNSLGGASAAANGESV
jgi:ABC-type maltose transport system permease subunit